MGLIQEFKDFLQEYKVMGLAVAIIIGLAATALVTSLVNNIIMPVISIILPKGDWETMTMAIGPANLLVGAFLASLINFIVIAFVVFLISKMVFKEQKVSKK